MSACIHTCEQGKRWSIQCKLWALFSTNILFKLPILCVRMTTVDCWTMNRNRFIKLLLSLNHRTIQSLFFFCSLLFFFISHQMRNAKKVTVFLIRYNENILILTPSNAFRWYEQNTAQSFWFQWIEHKLAMKITTTATTQKIQRPSKKNTNILYTHTH